MPPVAIGAVLGAASQMVAAGSFAITAKVIGMAVLNAALAGASMLLGKQPKPNLSGELQSRSVMVTSPIAYRQIIYGQTKVSGVICFLHKTGSSGEYLHLILAVAGHEINSFEKIYFEDEEVTLDGSGNGTGKWAGLLRVKKHLGASDQTADSDLVAEAGFDSDNKQVWTTDHRLRGIAYLYIRLKYSNDIYPNGIPNISCLVKGKKVYDYRDETTGWSENPALITADYMTDTTYGLKIASSRMNADSIIEAANACDEAVNLDAGGTEPRYTCNGSFDCSVEHEEALGRLRTSFKGLTFPTGDTWHIRAGVWRTPVEDVFTESDCRGPVSVQTSMSLTEIFNAVNGVYISPTNDYQASDYPSVISNAFAELDGVQIWKGFDLGFTDSPTMAQRLAKIELLSIRQPITFSVKANLRALKYMVGDIVPVSFAKFGWEEKNFEITNMALVVDSDASGLPLLGVDMVMRETDATIYDWNTDEENTADPAPNTNLPNPSDVSPPLNLQAASGDAQLYIAGDGTVGTRVLLTWDLAPWASVQSGGHYELDFKPSADSIWRPQTPVSGISTSVYILGVQDGVEYDFRIRSVSVLGVRSVWATLTNYMVLGKLAPPPKPTNFLVRRQADGTRTFTWTPPADVLDLDGYRIRFSTDTAAVWEDMEDLADNLIFSSPYETNRLAAGNYAFAIKTVDTSGNESLDATFIISALGNPRLGNALDTLVSEALGWPGTKTDCFVDNNNWLVADSTLGWDDFGSWDSAGTWLDGAVTTIVYEELPYDLGTILTFTPLVSSVHIGTPTYEVSVSDDGMSYGPWVDPNDSFTARYFKVRCTIDGSTPILKSLTTIIDAPTTSEIISDLDTSTASGSTGDRRLPLTKSYIKITSVSVTLQNVSAGWSVVLIDKDPALGPRIKIYNGSNSLADAVIDAIVVGV